jgi:Na+:H+ antiporter, NhaA family
MMDSLVKNTLSHRLHTFLEPVGGLLMLLSAMAALWCANSLASADYQRFIMYPLTVGFGERHITAPLYVVVKDVLMPFFFLLVGLELKYALFSTKNNDTKNRVILPLLAALGGMIVPAFIYIGITMHDITLLHGWAIPTATDIAFALCILALLGKHAVAPQVKVFLLSIAIYDDLGAILLIALFYSHDMMILPLIIAFFLIVVLLVCNHMEIGRLSIYIVLGVLLGIALHQGGVHSSIAGVITGCMIPLRSKTQMLTSPVKQALHAIHPWITFCILPLFAFVSAGISFFHVTTDMLWAPVPLAIALALSLGKPLGILGSIWLGHRLAGLSLSKDTPWQELLGMACLAGIGFTMSLFISSLAFTDIVLQEQAKIGIVGGSCIATLLGVIVLKRKKVYLSIINKGTIR